jgi:hypothetical protein
MERYDARLGGFGAAPKFPRPSEINALLAAAQQARVRAGGLRLRALGRGMGVGGQRRHCVVLRVTEKGDQSRQAAGAPRR